MNTVRNFVIRSSGGPSGWPRFYVWGKRVGHGGLDFASITIESENGADFFSMSSEQAERLVKVLPRAIAFARGKSGPSPSSPGRTE